MPKPLVFTGHARTAIDERNLEINWVEAAALSPDWEVPDPQPGVVRRYRIVPERDHRILRVVCVETATEIRILSAFLDRRARKPE
jgi:hypothetical protein